MRSDRQKLTAVAFLFNVSLLLAQTWCPPMRVTPYVADDYNVFGQGVTADNFGTPWCGWAADTYNPPAFNIYVSHYSDTTWSDPDTILPFLFFLNCDLATDTSGNVWIVGEDDGISACYYNGSTWSNLMAVPNQGSCCHYPVATGDSLGNLWVSWAGGGPGDGHHIWGNAYISGSWDAPTLISNPYNLDEYTYSMTADREGKVWVGWYAFSTVFRGICACYNDGYGWSDTLVIAEYSNYACGPALTVDSSGGVWAGWLDKGSNRWNIYVSYYEGDVWSEPMLVSSDTLTSFVYVGDWPVAMAGDDAGRIWLTWVNCDSNICYSCWDGSNWSTPAPVDTYPAYNHGLKMAFDGERIWATWIRWVEAYGVDTLSVYASYTYGVGVEEESTFPLPLPVLSLSQIYPNPFSSKTSITYQLQCDCFVSLRIYDITGKFIRILADGDQKLGQYEFSWDGRDILGRDCPSGIYFALFETPDYKETKKVILLR